MCISDYQHGRLAGDRRLGFLLPVAGRNLPTGVRAPRQALHARRKKHQHQHHSANRSPSHPDVQYFTVTMEQASGISRSVDNFGIFSLIMVDKMSRIVTTRFLLAVLAISILLFNPAGVCAGMMGATSPSHPCCPKPAAEKSPCICIDRQSAPPTVPSLTLDAHAELPAIAPTLQLAAAAETSAETAPVLPIQDRVVALHQILV